MYNLPWVCVQYVHFMIGNPDLRTHSHSAYVRIRFSHPPETNFPTKKWSDPTLFHGIKPPSFTYIYMFITTIMIIKNIWKYICWFSKKNRTVKGGIRGIHGIHVIWQITASPTQTKGTTHANPFNPPLYTLYTHSTHNPSQSILIKIP